MRLMGGSSVHHYCLIIGLVGVLLITRLICTCKIHLQSDASGRKGTKHMTRSWHTERDIDFFVVVSAVLRGWFIDCLFHHRAKIWMKRWMKELAHSFGKYSHIARLTDATTLFTFHSQLHHAYSWLTHTGRMEITIRSVQHPCVGIVREDVLPRGCSTIISVSLASDAEEMSSSTKYLTSECSMTFKIR